MSGLSLALGPILGGALVEGLGWRSIFWVNVPIVAAALVCTALFVPESRAARARRFDPVGQALVFLVLGSVIYAIIGSGRLGWTSPVILGLLAVAALGTAGILGYEPRRAEMTWRPRVAAFHIVVGQDLDMRPPAVAFLRKIGFGEIGRRKQRRNGG